MNRWLRELLFFVVFVLFQALVINNMQLFGVITPFIYFYVLLKMPFDISRSTIILLAFILGFIMDSFLNTFGLHTAACSLLGFIRNPLIAQFADVKELPAGSIPSNKLFGFARFSYFMLIMVTIHHLVLFSIDSIGSFLPLQFLVRMSLSIVFTALIMVIIETFNRNK